LDAPNPLFPAQNPFTRAAEMTKQRALPHFGGEEEEERATKKNRALSVLRSAHLLNFCKDLLVCCITQLSKACSTYTGAEMKGTAFGPRNSLLTQHRLNLDIALGFDIQIVAWVSCLRFSSGKMPIA
jgi:hypothetical protein